MKYEKVDEIWKMNFYGAYLRYGKGASVFITSPKGKTFNFSYRLEFEATNNVAEYEALLLGLEMDKDMGIKMLNIKGEFDLIILQVKYQFACNCKMIKKYRNAIQDTMEFFYALKLEAIPKEQNKMADQLAVATSNLQPSQEMLGGDGKLEINFRPSFPDNMEH